MTDTTHTQDCWDWRLAVDDLIERLRAVKWEEVEDDDRMPGDPTRKCVLVDMRPGDFRALLREVADALEAAGEGYGTEGMKEQDMTDRELLELAAKAAGIELRWHPDGTAYSDSRCKGYWGVWNPLTDDGDALRLVVKLKIDVAHTNIHAPQVHALTDAKVQVWEEIGADPYAATRRAIVRAAAEIGKEQT